MAERSVPAAWMVAVCAGFAGCAGVVGTAAGQAVGQGVAANFAANQFVTGTSVINLHAAEYLTDGKVGPRNRWVSNDRGRHRGTVFFNEDVTVGSVHVYSFGYDLPPIASFEVFAQDPVTGQMVAVPGATVSGNTAGAVNVVFAAPVTTRQIQIQSSVASISIDEIAVFPPNGPAGYPLGTDVNLHQGRQHRLALTPASTRATGTQRRAVVDGFVNDADVWRTNGTGPHWIELDVTDPPETNPVSVRTTTTPVRIGAAHLYTGLANGTSVVSSGRFQRFVNGSWVDIAGSAFSGNTSPFLAITFGEVVSSSRIRLFINDTANVTVREIVPLPPLVGGQMWPMGTSVVMGAEPDYRTLGDSYYALTSIEGPWAVTSDGSTGATPGGVSAEVDGAGLLQQYQVLLNVGTSTYRLRNRVTGRCLAVQGASTQSGAPVVESVYSALPHQRWTIVQTGSEYQFVNAFSGMALALEDEFAGAGLEQEPLRTNRPLQRFTLTLRGAFGKKGHGGFPTLAAQTQPEWAYAWGQTDSFPASVDFWPMQWGSFNWDDWPKRAPAWLRNAEPTVLMGFNEPDGAEQANMPVDLAVSMWPRIEVQGMPLLAPAPVNPTNSWITSFMNGVTNNEMRVEYVAVHSYGSPRNADGFMSSLQTTRNTFQRDVVVSEFSVVDWSDTNGWTDDEPYNFFAEVFWRMELTSWVRRYAVFIFTDEPGNPISDNRGEMLNADGTFTPEGLLFAAWDGDTQIRADTPYHLHNEGMFRRLGAGAGASGAASLAVGTRHDATAAFRWHLRPTGAANEYRLVNVSDGRWLAFDGGVTLKPAGAGGGVNTFRLVEAEHGWFYIEDTAQSRRLRSDAAGFSIANAGTTTTSVRWRFAPVYQGPPAAPRDVVALALGGDAVEVSWAAHGFRDLEGMRITRRDAMGAGVVLAENVTATTFSDRVPAAGSYSYEVVAVGDTGDSTPGTAMITVSVCPADFNGDFAVNVNDVLAAVTAINAGFDVDESGEADFFDVLAFLALHDAGCP